MTQTPRELAYTTLAKPLTVQEVAREAGLTADFVGRQIRGGRLMALPNGEVTGISLADYLTAHRRD